MTRPDPTNHQAAEGANVSVKNPTVSVELTARELRVITNLIGWNTPYTTLSDKLSDAEKRMRLATRDKNRAKKAARKTASTNPNQGEEMNTTAWTTENSDAIVWGTHDIETAKTVYDKHGFDYTPDWDSGRKMWAAPHLISEETWDAAEYGAEPIEGWVPYVVFDLV